MFGINGSELIFLIVLVLLVVGPSRMPEYAKQLRDLVKLLRRKANDARRAMREDFGEDFDVDWQKLDPRQYDPRRIVREALAEDDAPHVSPTAAATPAAGVAAAATTSAPTPLERYAAQASLRDRTQAAPFDTEAT